MSAPVPFTLISPEAPLISLPASVNGADEVRFILDTGASHTVVGNELGERLGLAPTEFEHGKGAFEPIRAGKVVLSSVTVGGTIVRDVEAVMMDLSGMRRAIVEPFDGILGYTFFREFVVRIDYPASSITFD